MNLKCIQLTKKRDNVEFEVENTEYNFTGKTNFVRCVGLVAPKKKKKKQQQPGKGTGGKRMNSVYLVNLMKTFSLSGE